MGKVGSFVNFLYTCNQEDIQFLPDFEIDNYESFYTDQEQEDETL